VGRIAIAGRRAREREDAMDEDAFNMSVRKFLKLVGITSQREIEKAVRDAIAAGHLADDATLTARVRLTVEDIGLAWNIEGKIALS
jgi:hypothetical protein